MTARHRWVPALLGLTFAALAGCDKGPEESTTSTTTAGSTGSGGSGGNGGNGGSGAGTTSGTGGEGGDEGGGPPTLTIVYGAPTGPASEPMANAHAVEGYATVMGANGSLVVAGTTTSVYEVTAAGPKKLEIVGDEPDLPLTTGQVRAMAPWDDGMLVAADNALFFTKGSVLQLSKGNDALHPLGITGLTTRIADDDNDGAPEPHIAIRAKGGAYELEWGKLRHWTVTGESGEPTAVFGQVERLIVAWGHKVYEVDKATHEAFPLVFDVGHVGAIACGNLACDEGSFVYFASDAGLVERAANGAYTLYPLAAEGQPAVPVESFALDPGKQRLYAIAGGSVLRVHPGQIPEAVATVGAAQLPRALAVDKLGDVWAGDGLAVKKLALGTPLSFATDVKPIVHEYCADCHATGANGAPKIDYESYDVMVKLSSVALMRIQDGTMPPIYYGKKLPKETIQLLLDWSVTKAP